MGSWQFKTTVEILAPAETAWRLLTAVDKWPEWSDSVTRAELLGDGPFDVGTRARLKQPGLAASEWVVTEHTPGESFTWASRNPGLLVTAFHTVTPTVSPDGQTACHVVLGMKAEGPMAGPMQMLRGKVSRNLVLTEARGLKEAAEKGS